MGFDIGWEVAGDRGLTDKELDAISAHVATWASKIIEYDLYVARARQPEIQAFYTIRPRTHEPGEDAGHGYNYEAMLEVFEALSELQRLLPDFEVRVEDDFNAYEWDAAGGEFVQLDEGGILTHHRFDEAQWTRASQRQPASTPADVGGEVVIAARPVPAPEGGSIAEARRDEEKVDRVAASWLRMIEDPAISDADVTRQLSSGVREPAVFDAALSILRTPSVNAEGYVDRETAAAIDVLRRAATRAEDVAAVLLARLRRDGSAPWRDRIHDSLEDCDADAARAVLWLEVSAGARLRTAHARALARHRNGLSLLRRARDVPFAAREAVDALYKLDPAIGEAERRALLEHPFWLIRWRAARWAPHAEREGDLAAAWKTLKDAQIAVDARAVEDFQRAKGKPSRELPPLPPALAGLASTCADHRRWALLVVDEGRRASDAPALVLADELDEALALEGYPRVRARWTLWPRVPADRDARGEWARRHAHEIDDATLRDVAVHGASVVAKRFPPPRVVLSPDELEHAERLVRAAEERGRQLLRLP